MTQTSAFHFESLVWDWPIAIYLFLIGISAGLVTLAVLLRRVYPQAGGADSTLLRTTLIVGPGAVILGLLILVFHLTRRVLASGLLWSLNGITAIPAAQASGDRYEVTQQRNPDAACLDCHKPDTEGMHGKHASVINPNNKLPVTCTNCHGQPSPQHREGVKDVMRFNEPMYKVGE
ncbi:NrfD/PsrC family molybdoenzyme membrane anchor subunit, partial [Escherichia coli]|uniref:NrfD/PsrC family molybdoenzyme membrane anchor subunit n=1 Tax=Escherichia coli TaxID=562 RepID=UPI0020357E0D